MSLGVQGYNNVIIIYVSCSRYVTACAFSPTDAVMATGSMDKTVNVWRIQDGHSCKGQFILILVVLILLVPLIILVPLILLILIVEYLEHPGRTQLPWSVNTNTSIGTNRKVASSIPLAVSRCPWARHLTLTAPAELAVALHGRNRWESVY